MALSITEANTISTQNFDKVMPQQVYDSHVILAKMKKDEQIQVVGGNQIQFPIRYQKLGMAKSMDPRAAFTFQSKATRTAGTLDFKYYGVSTVMHWDELRANRGKPEIVDLMADRASELVEDMLDVIATALYAATPGGDDIDSIPNIVDSANTYAGIAVADASAWAGIEDSSTTTMKLYGGTSLSYMINQSTFGKNGPTFHVTTRDLWTTYESRLQPQQRYEDKDVANLGFDSLKLRNKPVVADAYCPAGDWYGLDLSQFFLCVDPEYNFEPSKWFALEQVGFPNSMGKVLSFAGNLKCKMRKSSFKFTALDYTA